MRGLGRYMPLGVICGLPANTFAVLLDLQGWQLDKLAADPKKQADEDASDTDSDDEDMPFACLICRKPFTDPIVTRCGHYFDSACAIKRYAKTPKCLACGAPTGGIFNRADKILAKIKQRKKEKEGDDDEAAVFQEVLGVEADDTRLVGLRNVGEDDVHCRQEHAIPLRRTSILDDGCGR